MSVLNVPKSELDHTTTLSENIGSLFMSSDYSDVSLVVEGEAFPAHKVILASRSEYFRALLYGGLKESQQNVIELKSATKQPFKALLKYIYTGHLSLLCLKAEVVLDILGLSHEFCFTDLETSIGEFFRENLSTHNVCSVYDSSRLYQLDHLNKVCTTFIDRHASEIIKNESFKTLSADAMKELIQRDSFCAPEIDIFCAVFAWSQANPETNSDLVLKEIRLNLISDEDLFQTIRPTGAFSAHVILNAIEDIRFSKSRVRPRGHLLPEENVAASSFGTTVLQGEMRAFLLDGNSENYDMERGYTRHSINETGDNGIVIRLGVQSIINHIKMLLWDKDLRSYSYYIEVSMNQEDWTRVIDHSRHFCRSWQFLYFPERVVKYIRIVGTNNTVNKVFHVVSFEAMYSNNMEKLRDGIIVPTENVATIKKSATVIEGVSRSRNMLLNGETTNYDWDSGYTCHQLGTGGGHILVQLGQPYLINCIRLLLWDLDGRVYRYTISTSLNNLEWETVVDGTKDCQSWQLHYFIPRPVVFIKLRGLSNSANEVFHCVHLECAYSPVVKQEEQGAIADSPME